jgi:hypothetical protein
MARVLTARVFTIRVPTDRAFQYSTLEKDCNSIMEEAKVPQLADEAVKIESSAGYVGICY